MVSFKGLVPNFQAVLNWLVLIFIVSVGSIRAGVTQPIGEAIIFTLIGFLSKIGVLKGLARLPLIGQVLMKAGLYELGIAKLAIEVFIKKTLALADIVPAISRMIMGNGGGTRQTAVGTVNVRALMQR